MKTAHKTYSRHVWHRARFTGAVSCERCGLMPLDADDMDSPCDVKVRVA